MLQDASSVTSDSDRRNAPSPTKIRSDEEVETLQLTKKEKKLSLEEKPETEAESSEMPTESEAPPPEENAN